MSAAATAWVLVSAALVLFMTPGVALFYGGMVRSKNVLSVMIQSFFAMGMVTVLWAVIGFSLAFSRDAGAGLIGTTSLFALGGMGHALPGFGHVHVSTETVMIFQMMFAIITAALIVGGVVERVAFRSFAVLLGVWLLLVYAPIAHWVFSPVGWLAHHGVLDFAGGTVVEINSGFSTLAVVLVLGRRHGWPRDPMQPHSIPLSIIGAGILWFGWFGFNAGSALGASPIAVHAFVNTQLAAAAGSLGWLLFEGRKERVATALGGASGAIAGMVAITPCAGYVGPMPSLCIGALAGFVCVAAVQMKYRYRYDDSLDVFAIHGIGGVLGMVLLGFFAQRSVNAAGANGLLFGGGGRLLGWQVLAVLATAAYAFAVTYVIARVVDRLMGLRVVHEHEQRGLDLSLHGESAYSSSS
jgi:Amt family ammonium transporter